MVKLPTVHNSGAYDRVSFWQNMASEPVVLRLRVRVSGYAGLSYISQDRPEYQWRISCSQRCLFRPIAPVGASVARLVLGRLLSFHRRLARWFDLDTVSGAQMAQSR